MPVMLWILDAVFILFGLQRTRVNSNAPMWRLYTNAITPLPTSELSDFTQADFSGYADIATSFGTAFAGEGGVPTCDQFVQWDSTGTGTTNVVQGILQFNTLDGLIAAQNFQTPVLMGELTQSLPVLARMTPTAIYAEIQS